MCLNDMKKKVTLKQIAKELDVSVSTVSKALKDSPEIGQETIDKVKAFAKLYNYKPNNIAVSLQNRKTKNIAVIIPEIVHHFFTKVISGIEKHANERGYNVIVCLSNEDFEKEVINMETLANGSIDGFIISLSKGTQRKKDYHHLREVINQGMPLVMFDRVTDEIYCDKVVVDDGRGAYNAVRHMVRSGCKRIALVTTEEYLSVGNYRTLGYKNALEDAGIPIDEKLIVRIDDINCEKQIFELFRTQLFDGLLCVNEYFAVAALREARKRNIDVPRQLSIVAFSDGILAQNSFPRLTTVNQHGFEIGETSAKLLIDKLEEVEDDSHYRTEVIKTSLIERESTNPV
ncbi:transcriptional regulator [Zhouia amylolytica AD3]|uniref:Transcriptional regulator n=2 Tax=Zhouia amylolytica TaxID=376730 RepID=W2UIQ7_9FLAO|nr:transcriptional regulator [Zhouia amylolytica AD3]